MIELLELCGFEAQEAKSELPRVEKAFKKLGITTEDVERAKQRVTKYYDVELKGVRKLLGLYVRAVVDLLLAREEGKTKFIYCTPGLGNDVLAAALVSKSKEIYMGVPTTAAHLVLGCIFGKFAPVLEAAEKKWYKAGPANHGGMIKTLPGLLSLDLIPKPDLLVGWEYMCDTGSKVLDLVHELYGIPTCGYETCKDRELSEYPDGTKRMIDLVVKSMKRVTRKIQELAGFEITDDMLWENLGAKRNMVSTIPKLFELVDSNPMPISATYETPLAFSLALSCDPAFRPLIIDATNTLYEELQERVSKGIGVVEKGAPRILACIGSHSSDPRLEHLIGQLGIALVAHEGRFYWPDGRAVPDIEEPKDPYEAMATYLHSSMLQDAQTRIRFLIGACERLKVDGVLDQFHVGCRSVAGDALLIKDAITKELGIPVMLLEWDNFDPRVYNHEQYKKKLEEFKTTMNSRRERK